MKIWKPFRIDDQSINDILDMAYGYQRSRILFTASELDVFSLIGTESKTAEEIAISLNSDTRATERLLNALCAIGLLEKNLKKYSNSSLSLRFLVKSKPEYIGLMEHCSDLWEQWGNLTEAVKLGKPPRPRAINELRDKEVEAFIEAVHWRSKILAPEIADLIDLKNVDKIMDLGGGVGDYAIEFIKKKPGLKADLFTYPNCSYYAEEHLRSLHEPSISDNIEIKTGDIVEDDIENGYDLIFLSFVFQQHDIWTNMKLAKKVRDALKNGGLIVIQDILIDDNRISPEFNAMYSLELLVNTDGGETYTRSDLWLILKEAWFSGVEVQTTGFGTSLITAEKF